MSKKRLPKRLADADRGGYHPTVEGFAGKVWPYREDGTLDLSKLKPPKGGSAIQPPHEAKGNKA